MTMEDAVRGSETEGCFPGREKSTPYVRRTAGVDPLCYLRKVTYPLWVAIVSSLKQRSIILILITTIPCKEFFFNLLRQSLTLVSTSN